MQTHTTTVVNDKAQTIASKSPEGTAANPGLSSSAIRLVVIMLSAPVILIALLVWALFSAPLALVTLAAGLILTIGVNPTHWALIMGANERKEAEQMTESP